MSIPHKCPVCDGKGRMPREYDPMSTTGLHVSYECRACNGTGVVWSPVGVSGDDGRMVEPVEYGTVASRFLKG